ncbi:MAG: FmdE family protein [Desulfurella sp.]|jgi:formylmethanofuran dehydrogenase subunit E|uniref:Formylmethanofuran dehydrogenase subunit E n=1 Tax=Desulfurella multipotens TaxID=79269 RepID=A0A1G6P1Z6_9BACT|nr:FmdE family protein [Desulfurella multipotens]AHF96565.1 formylmethanofuran dehydrogenase subunit E [Desulfurella acetivorans A63]PMP68587.1 MAG: formylmethanofuran dehydrogenase [Desulfurella multipotens]SDC74069.1 formylmethanofuran dehydrogenase subunit E [Desulfurella multipotens]
MNDFEKLVDQLGLDEKRSRLLASSLAIHGHVCGGMPLGFIAGEAALKALGVEREQNMDKFVILESGDNHAAGCFADGVQFSTGATFGKGLMKKDPKGKFAFLLIDKLTKKAVHVRIKNEVIKNAFNSPFITEFRKKGIKPSDIPSEIAFEMLKKPFNTPVGELIEIKGPFEYDFFEPPATFNLVECEVCGQLCAENYARIENSKKVCLECFTYSK